MAIKASVLAGCLVWCSNVEAAPGKGRAYYEQRGEVVWEVPTEEKMMALTFDDGPDPADTPQILDLLKQYDVKATFFLIGNKAERYPELVQREVAEGHELGNHTYHHAYFNRGVTERRIHDELGKAQEAIYRISGQKPQLFRPPGGYYNEMLIQTARKEGFMVVMWSWHMDTLDWDTPGVHKITSKVLKNARNGDIVLFHDYVEGRTETIAALKQILPELKQRGYKFVTVSELLRYRKPSPVKHTEEAEPS
ncbi:polysaccharide deacetylase family protein [Paenibacillus rigui]|nr:polysaccharide deacetylase family protein [Paenibacillus rigui]